MEEKIIMLKCIKCGAETPEGSSFCSGCGSPIKEEQKTPQPPQQPVYTPPPMRTSTSMPGVSPLENIFKTVFSKTAIILVVAVGILFAWIGMLIMVFSPESFKISLFFSSMGFAAIGLFLSGGGIWNTKIDKFVRLGMVFIGIYLITQSLSAIGLITNLMRFF
jgi:hypothetical protein